MKKTKAIVFAIMVCFCAAAQDSAQGKLRFDVTGGFIAQKQLPWNEGKARFRTPEYLRQRRRTEPGVAQMWGLNNSDEVTDNPFGHGPMYIRPHIWYYPTKELELYSSLAIDHRGMSWGTYNTDNIALLPRFHAKYESRKRVKKDSMLLYGKVGYFEDYKNYEGLTLFNLDLQGIEASVRYGHLQFKAGQFGDLIRGYGLGIDGCTDYQLALLDLPLFNNWKGDFKIGRQLMIGYPDISGDQPIYSVSAAFHKNNTRLYVEGGYRSTDYNASLNTAFTGGIYSAFHNKRVTAQVRTEYRYYGGGFNEGFKNEAATHFRSTDRSTGGNLIGDMVYPLSFFGRPLSQWALYTEWDKQWIQSVNVFGNLEYKLKKSFSLFSEVDFNYLMPQGESSFLYPFFNTGIKFSVEKNMFASLSLTNRTMNLDKHYTSYYLTTKPLFQFELKRTL